MYFKFKLIPSLVLTILSAILILFNCPEIHCQSNNQGVAAIVDGHIITVDQVTELSTQLGGKGILNQLIGNKLVDHAAQKAGITIADSEIDSNLKHVSDTISPQTIDQYLSQRHITLKEFRNYLRVQLEIRKLLQPKLPAIQMVHVRDILINIRPQGQLPAPNDHMHSLKEAQAISSQILIRLKKGENFAKLASHYSEDIANNSSGGDIGIVTNISGVGTTAAVRAFGRDPNFSNAIFSMQVGQISSSPIQSVFGLHIVDILSTSDKPLSSDTSLYEQEYQVAQSAQLQNASHDYLNQLASSANITYFPYEPSAAQKGSAATVDGDPIPLSQVQDIAFRQFGHDCVYRLIVNQVIEDEAKSKNITASDQELEAQIKKTLDKNPGVTLDSMLSQTNSTMEDFRLQMRLQVLVNKLISTTFAPFKIVHIRHIALFVHWPGAKAPANAHQYSPKDADVLASSIIRKLGAGASFQSLAGQYSEDTTTSQTSGDLGYITGKDHYEPAFLVAAMKLKPLEFTKSPVRTSYGYEIIQAISTSDQHPKSENSAYANAQQKAKDLEVAAEMHDYIPSLIARHKVINNILN